MQVTLFYPQLRVKGWILKQVIFSKPWLGVIAKGLIITCPYLVIICLIFIESHSLVFVETTKYNWTLRETKFSPSRGWMSMDTWRSNQKMAAKPSVCSRTETVMIWWGTWFTWRHTEGPLQSEIYLDTCEANPALDIPVYQCIEQAS